MAASAVVTGARGPGGVGSNPATRGQRFRQARRASSQPTPLEATSEDRFTVAAIAELAEPIAETAGEVCVESLLRAIDLEVDRRVVSISGFGKGDDLNEYSILGTVPPEVKQRVSAEAMADGGVPDRCMGALCGMAIVDALGHPFEFLPARDPPCGQRRFDIADMMFYGERNEFRLQRGQWTDDASMGACVADSLIVKRGFRGGDMRIRFWCWWHRGYNNAFRKDPSRTASVGLGRNVSTSLNDVPHHFGKPVPAAFASKTEDAGNGSLMRLAPVAVFAHQRPIQEVHDLARRSSYTTHPGILAAEACAFLAHLIARGLHEPTPVDARAFLEREAQAYLRESGLESKFGHGYDEMRWLVTSSPIHDTERCWDWKASKPSIAVTLRARGTRYRGYPVSAGYFGSFSMDGLALALWSVFNTTSFDDAVVTCINLLGDADSTGSITGQLAGALYGRSSIHPQFVEWLEHWDDADFAARGLLLHYLGASALLEPISNNQRIRSNALPGATDNP